MSRILIVIPARYQSSRFPGKPLHKIAGVEMIKRVAAIANHICVNNTDCHYVVATDDVRVVDFCAAQGISAVMTDESCRSGTERCWDTVKKQNSKPELIINLQGDNPLCPPWILQDIVDTWTKYPADVFTPCIHLSWEELDRLREAKKTTPHSGTTVLINRDNDALAFSKTIIPTIRKEEAAKKEMVKSPVRQHIGLYAYTYAALEKYFLLPQSDYEKDCIEGLEQMRFLVNGMRVKMVEIDLRGREFTSGVDDPQDVARAEEVIAKYGELV